MAIDEKKLIEDLTEWFSGKVTYCLEHGYDDLREDIEDCFDAFTDIIEAQPKLDVPDTNVGKWIDTGIEELDLIYSGYKCSQCGFILCGNQTKYCPDCGVRMMPYTPPEPYKGDE